MTTLQISDRLADVFGTLQLFDTPMFMLLVDPDRTLRFLGLNRAHETATGIQSTTIAGHTPHAVLPPRLADAVAERYRRCLESGVPLTYEELLELPTGPRAWRTTLVPVMDEGRISAIIGTSFDITQKNAQLDASLSELATLKRRAEQLRTLSNASVTHMRGPLNNILTFCKMLRSELRPPLDQKIQILDLLMETAVSALDEIDSYEGGNHGILTQDLAGTFDLGHLCRDIAALADPGRNLSVSFPDAEIEANADSVRWILHSVLDRLIPIVGREIKITAVPDGQRLNAIRFSLVCDLLDSGPVTLLAEDQNWLRAGIESRGGVFEMFNHRRTGTAHALELCFVLPGKLLAHA